MRDQPTVPNRARPRQPEPRTVPHRVPPRVVPPPRAARPTLKAPVPVPPERPDRPAQPAALARERRPLPPVRPMTLPLLLPILGGVWWTIGTAALEPGMGTLLLAAGLSGAVALGITLRRRMGEGVPLPRGGRVALVRIAAGSIVTILLGGVGLSWLGLGEIKVPFAFAVVAIALFRSVRILRERGLQVVAGALLVLAVAGGSLAFGTQGDLYTQGLVGMGAGALCCGFAAVRAGLLAEALAALPRR